MEQVTIPLIVGFIALALGAILGYFARQTIARQQAGTLEAKISQLTQDAKREAQEIIIKAKDKTVQILEEARKEENALKKQLFETQERLTRREEILDQKSAEYDRNQRALEEKISKVKEIKKELEELNQKAEAELQRIAGLSQVEAREEILAKTEKLYTDEIIELIQKLEKDKTLELEKKAQELLTQVVQRFSRSHIADITTSVISIPTDELKGRIIGREGRNIKTLERLTGVEVMIDETPEVITVSAFDPIRREVAKLALEKLIKDGRIQPARIEEKVAEAQQEIKAKIQEAGEKAAEELGILDFPPQIIHLLGRLNFRSSYGQSVLVHSIEAAHIAGMLARELGANVEVAKKGALLHDIGKAVDHEVEGTHVELGRKILEKYGLGEEITKAIEAHHEEYPFSTPESYIVAAAEALSAARPGARKDTLEAFLKRIEELENIANSFEGVEKSYAIQAGREIRVFVMPEKIDDLTALKLARHIADRIQGELKYPGEIKVNVIRETRAVEYAR